MAQKKHFTRIPLRFRFWRIPTTWTWEKPTTRDWEERWGDQEALPPGEPYAVVREEEKPTELDGWACRDEFFKLPREKKAYLDFLNKVGLWWETLENAPPFEDPRSGEDVWSYRDEMRRALAHPKSFIAEYANGELWTGDSRWQGEPTLDQWQGIANFDLTGKVPVLVIETKCFLNLLLVTICADLAQGFRFQLCQRKDCGKPFVAKTAHKRKYCSWYCGHFESVKRQRRIAKKGAKH